MVFQKHLSEKVNLRNLQTKKKACKCTKYVKSQYMFYFAYDAITDFTFGPTLGQEQA